MKDYIKIPHYLKPCYFDALITGVYNLLIEATWSKMSRYNLHFLLQFLHKKLFIYYVIICKFIRKAVFSFVQDGSNFVKALALSSVIFCGFSQLANLSPLSANIMPPRPPNIVDEKTGFKIQACTTLAAGKFDILSLSYRFCC